jgi:SAM-dependent methyltransferase
MHYLELEASIYDKVYSGLTADIPFWQELAAEYCGKSGEALELACGTLRVALPVAEAGVRVTGIDESPHMLELARKKLETADNAVGMRVRLFQADMRSFDLGQKVDLVYIPFNTFGLLLTIEDQLATLDAVKKHLEPGGVFALDVFVPDVARMHGSELTRWQLEMDERFPDGSRVQRDNVREIDTRRQILSVTWRNRVYQDRVLQSEFVSDLQLSYFFPRELENLLARAGYEIVHYWGNYQRQNFWEMREPWKQLVVARPR